MGTNSRERKQQKNKNKTKKGGKKAVPCSEEANSSSSSWPSLPEQLIRIIAKESTFSFTDPILDKEWSLIRTISSSGVTKSWRIQSPNSLHSIAAGGPWLELVHNEGFQFQQVQLHQRFEQGYFTYGGRWKKPEPSSVEFLGCTDGFLVINSKPEMGMETTTITLWDPFLRMHSFLPRWCPEDPILLPALSSSCRFLSKHRREIPIMIILTGASRPAYAFTRMEVNRASEWRRRDCEIPDPHCSRGGLMRFSNGIWFQGKFYALSVEGTVAVIEEVGSDLRITRLGKQRAVPGEARRYRECLVESEGKVVLVFVASTRSGDAVEVYRLDVEELSWVRATSLGGAALFLGENCSVSVPAERLSECRGDSVYYVSPGGGGWEVCDVESGVCLSCEEGFSGRTDLFLC